MTYFVACIFLFLGMSVGVSATPIRIVSLSPAATEIICTLNGRTSLVGVSTDCDYPTSVKSLPKIGGFLQPSMERILALSPTIVVGIGQPNSAAFSSLRKKGIQVLLFDSPQKIDDIYTIISHVGTAMGHQERAKQVVLSLRTQVREIERSKPKIAPSVLIVIWHPPLTVAAGNTFISDMVHKAGGINVIESGFTPYPKLQRETMLYKNPEIILVADPGAISAVHTDAMIKLTLAAKYGFIISSIDPNLLLRPGPRFPMAMRQIQPILIAASPHE